VIQAQSVYQSYQQARVDKLKSSKLIVVFPPFAKEDCVFFAPIKKSLHKNFRVALNSFWDLSDSVIYTNWDYSVSKKKYYARLRKKNKNEVFLETGNDNNGNMVWRLGIYPDEILFHQLPPRVLNNDTTLLTIIEEMRFLRLDILYNSIVNKQDLGPKIILLDLGNATNSKHDLFKEEIKQKYPDIYREVEQHTIIYYLLHKNPGFLYVHKSMIINMEDGSQVFFN